MNSVYGLVLVVAVSLACAGRDRTDASHAVSSHFESVAIAVQPAPVVASADVVQPHDTSTRVDTVSDPFAGETLTVLMRQVAVYYSPHVDTSWNGALRAGAEVRLVRSGLGDEGCPGYEDRPNTGWYQIEHNGYVCVSRGAVLTRNLTRAMRQRLPVQPHRDAAMPYTYAMAGSDVVLYRNLPTEEEEQTHEPERFRDPEEEPADPTLSETPRVHHSIEELEGFEGTPVLRRATHGMFLSLSRALRSPSNTLFWRTHSGGWVRASALQFVGTPSLRGAHLDAGVHLPLMFVTSDRASLYALSARGSMSVRQRVSRWSTHAPDDRPAVTVRNNEFVPIQGGLYLKHSDVSVVTAHEPPSEVQANERWIDVNLDGQFVVAYEGSRAVFASLVSTGIPSTNPESNYETIQGSFRIEQKHLTTTMDGNSSSGGAYSIEDVPWVMYFHDSFALHGAFWHNGFGAVRSHGCVNLSPDDARWIFQWSSPVLPDAWHVVFSAADELGTRVYVHYNRQQLGEQGGPVSIPGH
jgi:lipoprotein-anchoring transpeptidase ErfK/SrfK